MTQFNKECIFKQEKQESIFTLMYKYAYFFFLQYYEILNDLSGHELPQNGTAFSEPVLLIRYFIWKNIGRKSFSVSAVQTLSTQAE